MENCEQPRDLTTLTAASAVGIVGVMAWMTLLCRVVTWVFLVAYVLLLASK